MVFGSIGFARQFGSRSMHCWIFCWTFQHFLFPYFFWIFRPQDNLDDMSEICRYRRTLGSAPLPLKRALMNDDTLNNTDNTVDMVDNTTVTNTADTTDTVNDTVKIL